MNNSRNILTFLVTSRKDSLTNERTSPENIYIMSMCSRTECKWNVYIVNRNEK